MKRYVVVSNHAEERYKDRVGEAKSKFEIAKDIEAKGYRILEPGWNKTKIICSGGIVYVTFIDAVRVFVKTTYGSLQEYSLKHPNLKEEQALKHAIRMWDGYQKRKQKKRLA